MDRLKLWVKSARQVVCLSSSSSPRLRARGKEQMNELHIVESSLPDQGISIVVGSDGRILHICPDGQVAKAIGSTTEQLAQRFDKVLDATNCAIIPGFVDCHTHALWAGDRLHEFVLKLGGATYLDIHKMGGGIHYTVRCTREASEASLESDLVERLSNLVSAGTTTVEVKSGYGLDTATELKMLHVAEKARAKLADKVDVIATFCGAHAVPSGSDAPTATETVISKMLPAVISGISEGSIRAPGGIDIFCEKGIFEATHTRRILQAGRDHNLLGNFHGDELSCTNSAELAVEMGARAVSHLEEISDEGIAALAKPDSPTVGVLLPTTAYLLRLKPPPARKMIDAGACVALGSDFNPNAFCYSMPMVLNLACVLLRMSPAEALIAATLNSAAALGVSDKVGALEPGRLADMIILDTPRWENLIYQLGCSHKLIREVVKTGKVCYSRPSGVTMNGGMNGH